MQKEVSRKRKSKSEKWWRWREKQIKKEEGKEKKTNHQKIKEEKKIK